MLQFLNLFYSTFQNGFEFTSRSIFLKQNTWYSTTTHWCFAMVMHLKYTLVIRNEHNCYAVSLRYYYCDNCDRFSRSQLSVYTTYRLVIRNDHNCCACVLCMYALVIIDDHNCYAVSFLFHNSNDECKPCTLFNVFFLIISIIYYYYHLLYRTVVCCVNIRLVLTWFE